jgi:ribosomal protein S12 methylthiotransferase
LVPYVDIPLQHISDRMLRAMNRGMSGQQTRRLMATLRERIPGLTVRTTFLVGHPGETEQDFDELLAYVREYRFDRLGVFAFSPEPGTPAAAITEGTVPAEVAEQRRDTLMQAQHEIACEKNARLIGDVLRVIVDGQVEEGEYAGRTAGDAPDVDNCIYFQDSGAEPPNGFVSVRVERAEAYDLYGVRVAHNGAGL